MDYRHIALIAALLIASSSGAEVSVGDNAPGFDLSNIYDSTFALGTPRIEPIVVIITEKDIGDFNVAWRDSLRTRLDSLVFCTVLDLGDVSRFLHFIARGRIRDKGTKAFIDWNGEVSEAWRGDDRTQVYLYGVTPDNVVRFRTVGTQRPSWSTGPPRTSGRCDRSGATDSAGRSRLPKRRPRTACRACWPSLPDRPAPSTTRPCCRTSVS